MSNYVIYTDTACDMKPETLKGWDVEYNSLYFRFNDSETEYSNNDMSVETFYAKMREGKEAKTSAANIEDFTQGFEKHLANGEDILYLGFSSGLSTTYNSARVAADDLAEKYPERKIITVDTLSASAGFGLLLYMVVLKRNAGASIEEAADYAKELIPKLCHWFTVDDLVYLKRGGRVNPAVAFVGGVFGIKPVLHMDNEGHLVNKFTARGRKKAIASLANKFGELAEDKSNGFIFISHADCFQDALELERLLNAEYGATVDMITDVGPVIGAHSGPGTLALFFVGKER